MSHKYITSNMPGLRDLTVAILTKKGYKFPDPFCSTKIHLACVWNGRNFEAFTTTYNSLRDVLSLAEFIQKINEIPDAPKEKEPEIIWDALDAGTHITIKENTVAFGCQEISKTAFAKIENQIADFRARKWRLDAPEIDAQIYMSLDGIKVPGRDYEIDWAVYDSWAKQIREF